MLSTRVHLPVVVITPNLVQLLSIVWSTDTAGVKKFGPLELGCAKCGSSKSNSWRSEIGPGVKKLSSRVPYPCVGLFALSVIGLRYM